MGVVDMTEVHYFVVTVRIFDIGFRKQYRDSEERSRFQREKTGIRTSRCHAGVTQPERNSNLSKAEKC